MLKTENLLYVCSRYGLKKLSCDRSLLRPDLISSPCPLSLEVALALLRDAGEILGMVLALLKDAGLIPNLFWTSLFPSLILVKTRGGENSLLEKVTFHCINLIYTNPFLVLLTTTTNFDSDVSYRVSSMM